jgi:hypothetical protein
MKMGKWAKAKSKTLEGKQVKCLISDEGHVWIYAYDKMSPRVRIRLANSPFNICPACLSGQVRGRTDADFFRCIEIIEQELRKA